LKDVLKMLFW